MADPDVDDSPGALATLRQLVCEHLLHDVDSSAAIERDYAADGCAKIVLQPKTGAIMKILMARLASPQLPPQFAGATLTQEVQLVASAGRFAATSSTTPVLTVPLQPRAAASIQTRACTMTFYVALLVLSLLFAGVLLVWGVTGATTLPKGPIHDTREF